jgi:hypothetical protein
MFKYLVIVLVLMSCGKKHHEEDDASQVELVPNGWAKSQTAHLYDTIDQAQCTQDVFGQIVFIKNESKFFFCDENQLWQEVNLKGGDGMAGNDGKDGKDGKDGEKGKDFDDIKKEYKDNDSGLTWGVGQRLTAHQAITQRGCPAFWRRATVNELLNVDRVIDYFKDYYLGGFFTGRITKEPVGEVEELVVFSETLNGVTTTKEIMAKKTVNQMALKPEIITGYPDKLITKFIHFWPIPTNSYGDDGNKMWLKPYYTLCIKDE